MTGDRIKKKYAVTLQRNDFERLEVEAESHDEAIELACDLAKGDFAVVSVDLVGILQGVENK